MKIHKIKVDKVALSTYTVTMEVNDRRLTMNCVARSNEEAIGFAVVEAAKSTATRIKES